MSGDKLKRQTKSSNKIYLLTLQFIISFEIETPVSSSWKHSKEAPKLQSESRSKHVGGRQVSCRQWNLQNKVKREIRKEFGKNSSQAISPISYYISSSNWEIRKYCLHKNGIVNIPDSLGNVNSLSDYHFPPSPWLSLDLGSQKNHKNST